MSDKITGSEPINPISTETTSLRGINIRMDLLKGVVPAVAANWLEGSKSNANMIATVSFDIVDALIEEYNTRYTTKD